jgi:ABC-2 type transport system permease protein
MVQCAAVILFGIMIDIPITAHQVLLMLPAALFVCLLGGAFGVLVLSRIRTAQTAYQLFPLIIFPQIILAGVFAPVKELPPFALIPSRLMPLTYAVDWIRAIFYRGLPEFHAVVIYGALVDAIVVGVLFLGCLIVGTYLFIERERNR